MCRFRNRFSWTGFTRRSAKTTEDASARRGVLHDLGAPKTKAFWASYRPFSPILDCISKGFWDHSAPSFVKGGTYGFAVQSPKLYLGLSGVLSYI